jgi:copper homeostasis protein
MPPIRLEICIESFDDAVTAVEAGADRLELNAALRLGGVTPSLGTLIEIRQHIGPQVPIVVMVRPREGDFCYSAREFEVMRRDIDLFMQHGASGFALGLLTPDGRVDQDRCRTLVEQVRSWASKVAATEGAVFHRAFDFVVNPLAAIDELTGLGFSRIMTSGQRETACLGAAEIARYIAHAAGRIEILPAAGIRPENVEALLRETGCIQVHASLREPVSIPNNGAGKQTTRVQLAAGLSDGNLPRTATSGRLVRAMLEKIGR